MKAQRDHDGNLAAGFCVRRDYFRGEGRLSAPYGAFVLRHKERNA